MGLADSVPGRTGGGRRRSVGFVTPQTITAERQTCSQDKSHMWRRAEGTAGLEAQRGKAVPVPCPRTSSSVGLAGLEARLSPLPCPRLLSPLTGLTARSEAVPVLCPVVPVPLSPRVPARGSDGSG